MGLLWRMRQLGGWRGSRCIKVYIINSTLHGFWQGHGVLVSNTYLQLFPHRLYLVFNVYFLDLIRLINPSTPSELPRKSLSPFNPPIV